MDPTLDSLMEHEHMLFVLEAKARAMSLQDHVPQAVCEMYACAKTLQSVSSCILIQSVGNVSRKPLSEKALSVGH